MWGRTFPSSPPNEYGSMLGSGVKSPPSAPPRVSHGGECARLRGRILGGRGHHRGRAARARAVGGESDEVPEEDGVDPRAAITPDGSSRLDVVSYLGQTLIRPRTP